MTHEIALPGEGQRNEGSLILMMQRCHMTTVFDQ